MIQQMQQLLGSNLIKLEPIKPRKFNIQKQDSFNIKFNLKNCICQSLIISIAIHKFFILILSFKIDQSPGLNPSAFAQGNSPYKKVYIDVVDLLSKTSIIGLYFAAYWSGPCIGWGSLLQSFKNEMNQETNNFLEIVIIPMCGSPSAMMAQERGAQNSSHLHHNLKNEDLSKDEKEMLDFQHLCGCLMMPFEEQHNIQALKEKFQVQEIPTFVVLDRYGQEVSRDGIYDIKKYTKQQLITKWSENFKKDQLQQF